MNNPDIIASQIICLNIQIEYFDKYSKTQIKKGRMEISYFCKHRI